MVKTRRGTINTERGDQPSTSASISERRTSKSGSNRVTKRRRAPKRRRTRTVSREPPRKRKPGRPRRRGITGGVRPGAGRKTNKSKNLNVGKRRKDQLAKKIRDDVEETSGFETLRQAFLVEVHKRFGIAAKNIVEAVTTEEYIPWAKNVWKNRAAKEPEPFDKRQCLALLLTADLSKHKYALIGGKVNEAAGVRLLRSYNTVRKCKTECIPEGLTVTDTKAEVPLQSLVNHTISRTVEAYMRRIDKKLANTDDRDTINATFTFCYGGDSATGYRMYNMRYNGNNNEESSDNSLFAAVINPISLKTGDGTALWANANPQSSFSVRPIFHEWEKETTEYVEGVVARLRVAIEQLEPITVVTRAGKRICIHSRFLFTLIDGKVFNIITRTTSHECPVCRSGRIDINDVQNIGGPLFEPEGHGMEHGIQPMHAWIKLFQDIWKIALNKPVRRAMQRFRDHGVPYNASEVRANAKRRMQQEFRRHGLLVDMPTQFGFGNTLNGNMARRIFRNRNTLAAILDIRLALIERYYVILCILNNTRYMPKHQEFKDYCITTLKEYRIRFYGYVPISPSVHKVLIHSADITRHMGIPSGVSSEGPAEAAHRGRKDGKIKHTRKTGRTPGNNDLICYELCRTDPVISLEAAKIASKYKMTRRQALGCLPAAAVDLLEIPDSESDSDDDDDDDGSGNGGSAVVAAQITGVESQNPEVQGRYNDNNQELETAGSVSGDEDNPDGECSRMDEEVDNEISDEEINGNESDEVDNDISDDEGDGNDSDEEGDSNESDDGDASDNEFCGTESEAGDPDMESGNNNGSDNVGYQFDEGQRGESNLGNGSLENNIESDIDDDGGGDVFGAVEDSEDENQINEAVHQDNDNLEGSDDEFESRFLADHFDDENLYAESDTNEDG